MTDKAVEERVKGLEDQVNQMALWIKDLQSEVKKLKADSPREIAERRRRQGLEK